MNLEQNDNYESLEYPQEMDRTITVKTLLAFVSAIGIPVLIFMYTLSLKTDKNEHRSIQNATNIIEIKNDQKVGIQNNDKNFEKVLDKLHEMDLKLKDKANRK